MSELIQQIRRRDYDRYLCCLFTPRRYQPALMALVAFNSEIAPVAEQVSEPMIGHIRLAWWREALDEIYSGKSPRAHHVVEMLAQAIRHYQLPREAFDTLIDARAQDVESKQRINTHTEFLHYLDSSVAPLHQLMAIVRGSSADTRAASHRYGMIGLLRALPIHADAGIIRFPRAVMQSYGLSPEAITLGVELERLRSFVKHMVDEALAYTVPKDSPKIIRLMDTVAMAYAKRLVQNDYQLSQLPPRIAHLPMLLAYRSII